MNNYTTEAIHTLFLYFDNAAVDRANGLGLPETVNRFNESAWHIINQYVEYLGADMNVLLMVKAQLERRIN